MVNGDNFLVRVSGKKENSFYIDYLGLYKIDDISKLTGIKPAQLKEKYQANQAVYDESAQVYYFGDAENAATAIQDIMKCIKIENKGRPILLTEAEIGYLRQALINEGSNTLHVNNKIKDAIFKKLNS